jgi:hypothetical protein
MADRGARDMRSESRRTRGPVYKVLTLSEIMEREGMRETSPCIRLVSSFKCFARQAISYALITKNAISYSENSQVPASRQNPTNLLKLAYM